IRQSEIRSWRAAMDAWRAALLTWGSCSLVKVSVEVVLASDPLESFVFRDGGNLDWPSHGRRSDVKSVVHHTGIYEKFGEIDCILNRHRRQRQRRLKGRPDCR